MLVLLWVQLVLGLATIPLSAQHLDGSMMLKLAEWAQRIVTFRAGAAELLADAGWVFKAHMFLGMTMFLLFPFTRLVHVWSGFATLAYVLRPYQVVRTRRAEPSRGPPARRPSAAAAPACPSPLHRQCHANDRIRDSGGLRQRHLPMRQQPRPPGRVATINGVALHAPGERLDDRALRERAWAELLRQEAVRQGLLPRGIRRWTRPR